MLPLTWTLVVERMTGIEPAFSAWEADVLPLNYIRALQNDLNMVTARHRLLLCPSPETVTFTAARGPPTTLGVDFR